MTPDNPTPSVEKEYFFGPFHFIPGQQLLLCEETPLRVGGRALAILEVLVGQPGEIVSKRDLFARVWPRTVVEESNLKVHIAALRRALSDGGRESQYIATVSGRGYRFVAPVIQQNKPASTLPLPACWEQSNKLPLPSTRMVGREENVAALLRMMEQSRLVSIVGPGGIGKSTLVLQLAESYIAQAGIDVCFVDLAPLSGPQFLTGAVATALGLSIHSGDGMPVLLASLHERQLLLVLDSCEHVIDAAAILVSSITASAPGIQVLTTSREPLRVPGEHVYRLPALEFPSREEMLTAAQALEYPAIALFALRASQSLEEYLLTDADVPAVAEICRRLEGIALAIELAATRMDAFGVHELAARLDDRFLLLKRGQRSSVERHRSLDAALDWSYELLPENERILLCALSLFSDSFTLDAATKFCADLMDDANTVIDGVANLVHKSLLSVDIGGPRVCYRLLDTTRAHARNKLELRGEMAAMQKRHVEFLRASLEHTGAESDGRCLDDVRKALSWAFSPEGDASVGAALTIAAVPLWMQLLLPEECCRSVELALSGAPLSERDEMKLRAAMATATLYASGPVPAIYEAWTRVLELADTHGDPKYQQLALWGMAVYRSYCGEAGTVSALAKRFSAIAASNGDHAALVGMERLVGTALHYAGDQHAARKHLEAMLQQYSVPLGSSLMGRFQLNQRSAALATLAEVLWLQGFPDQATQAMQAALQEARDDAGHPESLMNAISGAAFPLAQQLGDYAAAEALLEELSGYLARHAQTLWETLRNCLDATLRALRGEPAGLALLHASVKQLQAGGYRMQLTSHLGLLASILGDQGQRDAGLALIEEALALCEAGAARWNHAELLRIKGHLLEEQAPPLAEQLYRQALDLARQQGAPSWELRAANNLAHLKARQCDRADSIELLRAVFKRFSEGFETADLRTARGLLDRASA
ncbi:ATP-binding protein [Pseudoduganella sp. UC29_106]|uniref:ATP-binding protein n=1 Tax=Pseudoduganella sp. UC29_106 TaxID=3374553 RepID=UPI003756CDBD